MFHRDPDVRCVMTFGMYSEAERKPGSEQFRGTFSYFESRTFSPISRLAALCPLDCPNTTPCVRHIPRTRDVANNIHGIRWSQSYRLDESTVTSACLGLRRFMSYVTPSRRQFSELQQQADTPITEGEFRPPQPPARARNHSACCMTGPTAADNRNGYRRRTGPEQQRTPNRIDSGLLRMATPSALARLEPRFLLVDHEHFAVTTHNLSARLVLQRLQRVPYFHERRLHENDSHFYKCRHVEDQTETRSLDASTSLATTPAISAATSTFSRG